MRRSAVAAGSAVQILEQLLSNRPLALLQVPGQGRGLFASEDLRQGQELLREEPLACTPPPAQGEEPQASCYNCLRPLVPPAVAAAVAGAGQAPVVAIQTGDATARRGRQLANYSGCDTDVALQEVSADGRNVCFCSPRCLSAARQQYWGVERLGGLGALHRHCAEAGGQRFPLLAARLACRIVADVAARREPLTSQAMGMLTFCTLPEVPEDWRHTHKLTMQGLEQYIEATGAVPLRALHQELLPLQAWVGLLSACHVNTFRVPPPLLPPALGQPGGLAAAAAAMVAAESGAEGGGGAPEGGGSGGGGGRSGGEGGGPTTSAAGSALYLASSMFNHQCDPNVLVQHPPGGGAAATFRAARDIRAWEQVCISYVDEQLPLAVRRRQLEWGYGFRCMCPRCKEEEEGCETRRPS